MTTKSAPFGTGAPVKMRNSLSRANRAFKTLTGRGFADYFEHGMQFDFGQISVHTRPSTRPQNGG